jgi:hypothetical protein
VGLGEVLAAVEIDSIEKGEGDWQEKTASSRKRKFNRRGYFSKRETSMK